MRILSIKMNNDSKNLINAVPCKHYEHGDMNRLTAFERINTILPGGTLMPKSKDQKKCQRCLGRWIPIIQNPKRCPHCKSQYWDQPRQRRIQKRWAKK